MLTLLSTLSGITAVLILLCFMLYLRLLRFVVSTTRSTDGLKDVAVAMRAFASLPVPRLPRPPWPRARSR